MIGFAEACHEIKEYLTFLVEIDRRNGAQGEVRTARIVPKIEIPVVLTAGLQIPKDFFRTRFLKYFVRSMKLSMKVLKMYDFFIVFTMYLHRILQAKLKMCCEKK